MKITLSETRKFLKESNYKNGKISSGNILFFVALLSLEDSQDFIKYLKKINGNNELIAQEIDISFKIEQTVSYILGECMGVINGIYKTIVEKTVFITHQDD
ncbi:hypothetical protein NGRA_1687 [Nosema granulosis]|uniref:Uncharacterized protein n=1 Tax=Nosema granulosis TaxID=83296 RepID=A0A9P6GZK5_9MICR|nr:hypothetical protein NGRA_1687 [Nosema granulosis]